MEKADPTRLVHPSIFFRIFNECLCIRGCGRAISPNQAGVDGLCDACRQLGPTGSTSRQQNTAGAKETLPVFDPKGRYPIELQSNPKVNYELLVRVGERKLESLSEQSLPSSVHKFKKHLQRRHPYNAVPKATSSRRATDPHLPSLRAVMDPPHGRRVSQPSPQEILRRKQQPVFTCAICRFTLPKQWKGKFCEACRNTFQLQSNVKNTNVPPAPASGGRAMPDLSAKTIPPEVIKQVETVMPPSSALVQPTIPQPKELPSRLKLKLKRPRQPLTEIQTRPPTAESVCIERAHKLATLKPQSNVPPTLRDLKLCATDNCTGSIPAGSGSTHCQTCVRLNWKRRRIEESPASDTPSPSSSSRSILLAESDAPTRRKSVTWSATIIEKSEDGMICERPTVDDMIVDPPSEPGDIVYSLEAEAPAPISGWDSDLSELTDESDSDDEPQEAVPVKTGLKIRLPARPHGPPSRPCAAPKCKQALDAGYRWKTCVLCRARSRFYQRKRQNVENPHPEVDKELLAHDTPISSSAIPDALSSWVTKAVSLISRPIGVVSGSRLCSTKTCTHVLPAISEYESNLCSICRLRDLKTKSRSDNEGSVEPSLTPCDAPPTPQLLLQSLLQLPNRPNQEGRCPSQDCGFILRPSGLCRQCVSRRLVLGRLARKERPLSIPSSPQLRSYPQFKCFSALLADFSSRLRGFQNAQSVFYLVKAADPKLADSHSVFAFDGEFSTVSADYDVMKKRAEVDAKALEYRKEIERVGKMTFLPKRLVSVLENGGIAVRFLCQHQAPVLEAVKNDDDDEVSVQVAHKSMHAELEIATLPDRSHLFLPGHKTIIRFRLLG